MALICSDPTNSFGQDQKVEADGILMTVKVKSKESKYIGLPHGGGIYLRKGFTEIDLSAQDQSYHFKIDEELSLFGVHFIQSSVYLVFRAEYKPERGFLAYKDNKKGGFDSIDITFLPEEIATPNYGKFKKEKEVLVAAKSMDEILETMTACLWSQIATGKSFLPWGVNEAEVAKIWKASKWRKK